MNSIAIIGTFDTKGREFQYLKGKISEYGCKSYMIDCGVMGSADFEVDFANSEVAKAAGSTLQELIEMNDVSYALEKMALGAKNIVERLYREGKIQGAVSMGGGQGTYLGMIAMSVLPIGVPKLMISTLARAVKELFFCGADTVVIDPIVDVSGLNSVLEYSIDCGASIICSLVEESHMISKSKRPVLAVTMFGTTTKCVDKVRENIEKAGYEVWVFHSNGVGGMNMEKLIRCGLIQGVLDLTTAEISQTYLGGTAATISSRLEAAGELGIPQVVSVGGVDLVNFLARDTVPERYQDGTRRFHMHNPTTTIMRSEARDYDAIGQIFAKKLNKAKGPVKMIFPMYGFSEYDKKDGVWYDPAADMELLKALKKYLNSDISVIESPYHINDAEFAKEAAQMMLNMLSESTVG